MRVKLRGRSASVKAGETWPPPLTAAVSSAPPVAEAPRPSEQPHALGSAGSSVGAVRPRESAPRPRAAKDAKVAAAVAAKEEHSTTEASPTSVQRQFELATQIEAKEPAEAIRLYEGIERSSSGWASNALFAHGRLEAARGNRVAARRILTQYLSRFPSGANAPDARLLLSRLE